MANGHGGYRKPTNPAPASGPGALSRRTDGQPMMDIPNAAYGEQQTFQDVQGGAPMAQGMGMPGASAAGGGMPLMPFGAGSQRPDEPVTAGVDVGAGPGSAILGMLDEDAIARKADSEALYRYLPVLEFLANRPGAKASLKNLVRKLKASQ